jgi:hypothetical protein
MIYKLINKYVNSGWMFFLPYNLVYIIYSYCHLPINKSNDFYFGLLFVFKIIHFLHLAIFSLYIQSLVKFKILDYKKVIYKLNYYIIFIILLIILIILPGLYLEFPSDSWEHLSRILNWGKYSFIKENVIWNKSSYFLVYSLIQDVNTFEFRIVTISIYNVIIILLLLYQYYNLAINLFNKKRLACICVFLNFLTFGNSSFSFYRYYSLSSSLIAQIIVIALINYLLCIIIKKIIINRIYIFIRITISLISMFVIIYFSHRQGYLVLLPCFISIIIWYLINKGLIKVYQIIFIYIISGLVFLILPLDSNKYFIDNYTTHFYIFNLFNSNSIALDRVWQILGLLGLFNLILGIFYIRYNYLVGWLTIVPVLLLLYPPFCYCIINLLGKDISSLSTFNRILFSIPSGFCISKFLYNLRYNKIFVSYNYSIYCLIIVLTIIIPSNRFGYNRLFHLFNRVPDDLTHINYLTYITKDKPYLEYYYSTKIIYSKNNYFLYRLHAIGYNTSENISRDYWYCVRHYYPLDIYNKINFINVNDEEFSLLYTSFSTMGILSNHWLPSNGIIYFY